MVKQSIVPAIIPISFDHLAARLREVHTYVRSVQIDVMDGTYAPASSWPYVGVQREMFESMRREDEGLPFWQELDLEIDLMVHDPLSHIRSWSLAGATRCIVHVETTSDLSAVVALCNELRMEVALALKPSTEMDVLEPYVNDVVFVQCMGNDRIGYHGVPFDPIVVERISTMHTRWPELLIGVDIGVSETTLPSLLSAGARRFAAGSAVFGRGDAERALKKLQRVVADNT